MVRIDLLPSPTGTQLAAADCREEETEWEER